uniref:Phosphodiesterase n=1 Tax=Mastacembelus armatus TaxID=205130 RepID=A0A3Q3KYR4_9TELE
MEPGRASPGAAGREESFRRETVREPPIYRGMGWFFSPLWSPRSKTRCKSFGDSVRSGQVDVWLDDHSDFTRAYFLRRASHAPDWMDRFSPDVLGSHTPCSPRSPRSSHFSLSPCRPLSPICSCSPDVSHSSHLLCPTATKTAACGHGESCLWLSELLRGGLSWMGSVAELCHEAVLHAGELLAAQSGSLSLVKKDCRRRSSLEEVIAPTSLGCSSEGNICSHAHLELVKGIMGWVLATGLPINLREASEDLRFNLNDDQTSDFKIRTVLSMPIKNHRGEVLSNHMDLLGMVLDNVQLYESSRQEAKRSQVLSKEHHSFEVLLSKMAATIMPFTHAQYCTIFIPREQPSISFSRVIHLECEELGSTCQIYRRERDISDIDPSYALQTLATMETLNMSESTEESIKSLICCPVRNERSENVIAVCQLMNKLSRDSDELEVFNRYDERLLEDLAVYCGLALQYAQAVLITEERRASIEVTQEVLAYHITAAEPEIQALQVILYEATIPSAESLHILDFHFSDFGLPEDLTTQATIRMFLDLRLVQDFNIDYKGLCQWVLTVKRGYRNNVPYHNWNHALSTAQSMFAMLMATDHSQNLLTTIFSRLEILALMIATLNHDLDHRGVSNSYIERSQQPLAQLYGHSSLENHHYNLCLFILNNTGSQILSGLSAEDHKSVLHMIKRAILATDLTVYMERRKEFFSLTKKSRVSWKSEKQRDLLRSMLMTASDLSAITKPWPEQKRIANLVAMEFFAQGDKEKEEFKIKPIVSLAGGMCLLSAVYILPSSTDCCQIGWIYIISCFQIIPSLPCGFLTLNVSRLFDTCTPLLNGCKKNRENWLRLAEDAEEANSDESSSLTLETQNQ